MRVSRSAILSPPSDMWRAYPCRCWANERADQLSRGSTVGSSLGRSGLGRFCCHRSMSSASQIEHDSDPDHRELSPTRLLDDGEWHSTDLGTATFGARRCGRPIPGLTASATCDCDGVVPAFTAEIVVLATHRTYDPGPPSGLRSAERVSGANQRGDSSASEHDWQGMSPESRARDKGVATPGSDLDPQEGRFGYLGSDWWKCGSVPR
jgi:hypothetical protein